MILNRLPLSGLPTSGKFLRHTKRRHSSKIAPIVFHGTSQLGHRHAGRAADLNLTGLLGGIFVHRLKADIDIQVGDPGQPQEHAYRLAQCCRNADNAAALLVDRDGDNDFFDRKQTHCLWTQTDFETCTLGRAFHQSCVVQIEIFGGRLDDLLPRLPILTGLPLRSLFIRRGLAVNLDQPPALAVGQGRVITLDPLLLHVAIIEEEPGLLRECKIFAAGDPLLERLRKQRRRARAQSWEERAEKKRDEPENPISHVVLPVVKAFGDLLQLGETPHLADSGFETPVPELRTFRHRAGAFRAVVYVRLKAVRTVSGAGELGSNATPSGAMVSTNSSRTKGSLRANLECGCVKQCNDAQSVKDHMPREIVGDESR